MLRHVKLLDPSSIHPDTTTTTILWPLYRSTCVNRHLQLRILSVQRVSLPACPCRRHDKMLQKSTVTYNTHDKSHTVVIGWFPVDPHLKKVVGKQLLGLAYDHLSRLVLRQTRLSCDPDTPPPPQLLPLPLGLVVRLLLAINNTHKSTFHTDLFYRQHHQRTEHLYMPGFVANSKYEIQALFKDPNCIFKAPKLSTKSHILVADIQNLDCNVTLVTCIPVLASKL